MKLVLVFLSAAVLLTVSSAATTQRPVDTTSSVIEQTTPVTEVQQPINELQELEIEENEEDLDPEEIIEEEINNEEESDDIVEEDDRVDEDDDVDDDDDEESDPDDDDEFVEGLDVSMLSEDELHGLLEADEERFVGFFDAYVGLNEVHERNQLDSGNKQGLRRKRWVPLAIAGGRIAFTAGRALLSRFARRGITKSGQRITKHYSRPGNYFSGLREFKNLKPTNVQRIGGSKFKGWTGTSGPYRVTVRSGSKGTTGANGSPTLSVSSKNGQLIRKFRFD